MMFFNQETEVRKLVDELKLISENSNKKLTQKRYTNTIYAFDYFENIHIREDIAQLLMNTYPKTKKMEGIAPANLKLLIQSSETLNKAIIRTHYLVRKLQRREEWELASYVDHITLSLKDIKSLFVKKTTDKSELPLCALCWREVDNSKNNTSRNYRKSRYYCEVHVKNKSLYHKDRNALMLYQREKGANLFDNAQRISPYQFFIWVRHISPNPNNILKVCSDDDLKNTFDTDWRIYAQILLEYTKKNYPSAYLKIAKVKPCDSINWLSYANRLKYAFDPPTVKYKEWLAFENNYRDSDLILTVFARYEGYCRYSPACKPSKGESLRKQIIKHAKSQIKSGNKINQSEIARKLGKTKQQISALIKKENLLNCL